MVFGIQLLEPSGWGIVALIALAVLRGYLVPRRILEDVRKDRDDRVAEAHAIAEMWHAAYEYEREARGQLAQHSELSIATASAATAALRAVAAPAGEGNPDANAVA